MSENRHEEIKDLLEERLDADGEDEPGCCDELIERAQRVLR